MDVFGAASGEAGKFLRDAAIAAAHDLGLFDALTPPCTVDELARRLDCERGAHRLRALVEVLVGLGALRFAYEPCSYLPGMELTDKLEAGATPGPRPAVPTEGWGRIAEVIRTDRPLELPGGELEARMHAHLAEAGAAAARELFAMVRVDDSRQPSLLDLGGGAGAYTAAFLDANPAGVATLVDYAEVIALARVHLARFGDRVRFVVSDIRTVFESGAAHRVRRDTRADASAAIGVRADASEVRAHVGTSTNDEGAVSGVRADASEVRAHVGAASNGEGAADRVRAGAADRVRADGSEVRAHVGMGEYDIVLLANVLHLHGPIECEQICAVAARAAKPGGRVVVKDLRIDDDRSGPIEGLLFALNMAVYTGCGSVYSASDIRRWFGSVGIDDVDERRFEVAPDAFAIIGRRPAVPTDEAIEAERKVLASRLSRVGKIAWRELVAAGKLRAGARPRHLVFPRAFGRTLASALLTTREDARAARVGEGPVASLARAARMTAPETVAALGEVTANRRAGEEAAMLNHYLEIQPRGRVAQIVGTDEPAATFMHTPLDWAQLPRMTAAIDRLYDVLTTARVDAAKVLGALTADAFRAAAPTFGELFMRTHYGACMPMLYGYPTDLAYFAARGRERGDSVLATMDRYLTAPLVHELCHFGRDRDALPTHLDECIGGWLGVHAWPEFMVPEDDRDDAIPHSPLLAQIGQAFARAFGVEAIVRAQSGEVAWRDVLGERTVAAIEAICREDWRERRTLHFLSDTMKPRPWVALGLAAGAGQALATFTTSSLARLVIGRLALRADDAFDRTIVSDAINAMCLVTEVIEGSMRTRFALPTGPIRIDASECTVRCGDHEYWLPPEVAGRMLAAKRPTYELRLARRDAIPDAVAAICAASCGIETGGFSLVVA